MLIALDQNSDQPLYHQIVQQLREQILAGVLNPGDQLPSVRQLAADLVTSLITTRRAYQDLEAAGLIESRAGRGTYVCALREADRRKLTTTEVEQQLAAAIRTARRLHMDRAQLLRLVERHIQAEGLADE